MKDVNSLFDYIFYRIYDFSRDKADNVPDTKGSLLLSLIQFLTIVDIMVFVKLIYDYPFPSKYYFLPLAILLAIINWFRYERKYDIRKLEIQWKNEGRVKRIRQRLVDWFILAYIVFNSGSIWLLESQFESYIRPN